MSDNKDYYTPAEVAEMLRVDTQSVLEYIRLGKIKAVKLSKRTFRIPKEEIEYLLKGEK